MSTPDKDLTATGIAGNLTRAFITSPLTPLFLLAALILGLVALVTLPREEEPQISVPMVDIHLQADGLRAEWIAVMKHAIATIVPKFSTSRMVRDYLREAYLPAARRGGAKISSTDDASW